MRGPRPDREGTDRVARPIVQAIDLLDAEPGHQPVLHHGVAAAAALLGRLEDHHGRAVEVARFGQVLCCSKEHGRMAVMTAGVHQAGRLRAVRRVRLLLDGKRVHVGSQPNDLSAGAAPAFDDPDDARAADAGDHLVAAKGA
jgi:hypothetical protein